MCCAALQARLGLAMILVTHDMAVVAYACDRVAVMYAGRVVESGRAAAVLERPLHPYTMGLTHAFPDVHGDGAELVPIEGAPPVADRSADRLPLRRRAVRSRCRAATWKRRRCMRETPDHQAACWRAGEAPALRAAAARPATWAAIAT